MTKSPIYDPAHEGQVAVVSEWLDKNPEQLNKPIGDGLALLHVASAFGHEVLVEFLLGRGALVNVETENPAKETPLHFAALFRDEAIASRICDKLVAHGAELNGIQTGGQTALHHAVGRGSVLLVKTLIEAGADPFLKDAQGQSAMQLAAGNDDLKQALKRAHSLV